MLDESDTSGNVTDEYVYLGSQRVAHIVASGGSVYYYGQDHLGTSRVMVAAGGTSPCYDADFYPFGGERAYTTTCTQNYKFTGKERDPESGLDNFGARYDSSATGRFISPDSMLLMRQKMTDPQQWNMYPYVRNNPLRLADADGRWPTEIHNKIIDNAFPGLTDHQRDILKSASYSMDHCMTCQLEGNAYQHSMKAPSQSPAEAKQETQNFIKSEEHLAQIDQKKAPEKVSDINDQSLSMFGNAAHTVADGISPAHTDSQGNPLPWDPYSPSAVKAHEAEESTISDDEMTKAVNALQQAFQNTYGQTAEQQATTPPAPPPQQPKQPQQ